MAQHAPLVAVNGSTWDDLLQLCVGFGKNRFLMPDDVLNAASLGSQRHEIRD
jgi:hypothetical protein